MTPSPRFHNAPLTATPSLERLLRGLGQRLWWLVLLRGVALALVAFALVWAWAFFADFLLAVPASVRAFHGGLLVLLPLIVLWRTGLRHLRRLPNRRELAILVEQQQGGEDLFSSAADFQLSTGDLPTGSEPLVQRLFQRAEQAAAELPSKLGVLDSRRPLMSAGLALLACTILAMSFLVWPDHQNVFKGRLFGAGSPWPQLTFLSIEVALENGVTEQPGGLLVRIARGEDLPITVLVQGRVPDEVKLRFSDKTERSLTTLGERGDQTVFSTTLRGISRDFSFIAIGGDDQRGLTRVTIKALSPPDITQLVARVTPPAYSGLKTATYNNTDLVVLQGSQIDLTAEVSPPKTTGVVRLLPEDRTIDLISTDSGLRFSMTAQRSLRLRFELLDAEGLTNPDPGLWSITVDDDHAPQVSIRSPETLNLETTVEGILPLWVSIKDDFAVESSRLIVEARSDKQTERALPLDLKTPKDASLGVYAFAPIPLKQLQENLEPGTTLWVSVEATDNRMPAPGVGQSPKVSLRVLSNEDYMQRVQDRLAGTRRHVSDLFDLQREKLMRTEELADAFSLDSELGPAGRADLNAAISGARRIEADSMGILRGLASLCADVLHARVDSDASGQVQHLDQLLAKRDSAEFNIATWTNLVAKHQAGQLGKAGFAGHLITLTGVGLELATEHSMKAREALDLAGKLASQTEDLRQSLDQALALQRANLVAIESLLGRLAEWDNFQSVLSLTREVLERQRAMKERIKELASQ